MISKEIVKDSFDQGTLVPLIFQRHAKDEEALLVEALVDLHNSEAIDVFSVAPSPDLSALAAHDFFVGQHLLGKVIPRLQASSTEMMTLISALVRKGGEDLAANLPNGFFTEWLTVNPDQAREIIEGAKSADPQCADHLTFALTATSDVAEAHYFASEVTDHRRLSGIAALSRIEMNVETRNTTLEIFSGIANSIPDDPTCQNLLEATLKVALDEPQAAKEQWLPIVEKLCAEAGPHTRYQAAKALWSYAKSLDVDSFNVLTNCIEGMLPGELGTARQVDVGISAQLTGELTTLAIAFLQKLISNKRLTLDSNSSLTHQLPRLNPRAFCQLVVDWLSDGSPDLCLSLRAFLREDGALDLSEASVELEDIQRYFVARKAIGYWFTMPVLATSVVVSLIRSANGEVRSRLGDLLLNPILLNYGGAAHDYLSSLLPGDPAADEVARALSGSKGYLDALKAVKMIAELRPTESNLQAARAKMGDEIRQAMKEAEKSSVILSLVSRSTLLYGRRSLTRVGEPGENGRWSEFALQEHSAMFELPRMEVVDPNGIDHMLRVFRLEQLKR